MSKTRDLTEGSIAKGFLLFALPLFLGSLFQQLYSTADLLFVGNVIGKTASAAVGASSLLVSCLISLFTGISVGAGIVVSHYAGAKNESQMRKAAASSILAGMIGGFVMMVVAVAFAGRMLLALNTPASVMDDAVAYVQIYFLSMVPMILYNMCAAILRSMGDAKTPFYVLATGGFVNVAMDFFFIVVLPWGVRGTAAATFISQTFTALILLYVVCKRMPGVLKAGIHKENLLEVIRMGLPVGIQSMLMVLSNVVIQYFINGFGEDAVAAFAIYHKAESVNYLPVLAFGQAMTTFVGQNAGAGRYDRIKKAVPLCNGVAVSITGVISLLAWAFRMGLARLFCPDGRAMTVAAQMMAVTFPFYFLYAIQEVTGGAVRGLGKALQSMVIYVSGLCVIRVALLFLVYRTHYTVSMVMATFPVTWVITVAGFLISYLLWSRKDIVSWRCKEKAV